MPRWPNFNPRFPRGKRQDSHAVGNADSAFQSTLPAREATSSLNFPDTISSISIHASREGSDGGQILDYGNLRFQSTLPAREATNAICTCSMVPWRFQSTLPAREATIIRHNQPAFSKISIHAFREGSDHEAETDHAKWLISIHASREGSDHVHLGTGGDFFNFNPRFPRGKRLPFSGIYVDGSSISIHASREGSDLRLPRQRLHPRGFQSTLPAREATVRSSCPLMTTQAGMVSANRDF